MFRAREYVASLRQMLGRPSSPDATSRPKKGKPAGDVTVFTPPKSDGQETSVVVEGGLQKVEERGTPIKINADSPSSSSCSSTAEIDSSLQSPPSHAIAYKRDMDLQTVSTRGSDASSGSGARNNRSGGIEKFAPSIVSSLIDIYYNYIL